VLRGSCRRRRPELRAADHASRENRDIERHGPADARPDAVESRTVITTARLYDDGATSARAVNGPRRNDFTPQNRPKEPEKVMRNVIGDIPQWFPNTPTTKDPWDLIDAQQLPNISLGNTPVNPPAITVNNKQHINSSETWDITDDVMWVKGGHTVKTGIYFEYFHKIQVQSLNWNGTLNFAVDANSPFNTRNGFSNALLGYFNTYSESTLGGHFDADYWTTEFYIQDNWRVKRGLTLD
jgi:hypothetical protein